MKTWEIMNLIVKTRCKQNQIQQKELAITCGYTEKRFSMLINGRKPITDEDIEKFCSGMSVCPNDLFPKYRSA